MSVEIDGIETKNTLNGPVTITKKGIAVPSQIRMNLEDPTQNTGEIRFYQSCLIPQDGSIITAVNREFQVRIEAVPDEELFTIAQGETLTGREIKLGMKSIFLTYSELNERPPVTVIEPAAPEEE